MSKKTTFMIDEELYATVRAKAAAQHKSTSSVVAEALRAYLSASISPQPAPKLTVAEGGGWIGPVGVDSTAKLLDYLDEDVPFESQR